MMRPLWLALALARCTTMGELREKPPDLVLTSRPRLRRPSTASRTPTTASGSTPGGMSGPRWSASSCWHRSSPTSPPSPTARAVACRRIDGWGRWRLNAERVTAALAACGRSPVPTLTAET
jgi:hypothetical protein